MHEINNKLEVKHGYHCDRVPSSDVCVLLVKPKMQLIFTNARYIYVIIMFPFCTVL